MTLYRVGELFCGPGGIAKGLDLATQDLLDLGHDVRVQHTWANDYDADTVATYKENFPSAQVIHKDVRKLNIDNELSTIDGFTFGFPCNDFSVVGEQKGINGTFGPLYEYGAQAIDSHNPLWFLAENVGGLRNSNDGTAFTTILGRLQDAGASEFGGYTLYPHLYKFEDYGVPQRRHRILIVGIRNDLDRQFLVPSAAPYSHLDNSVRTALSNIPATATHQELTKQSPVVVERLQHIQPGQNAFTADLPDHLKLNVQGAKISQIYRRLEADKPAYTVTGSGGGGTHVYHYEEDRALTNRERARLQTFPDEYTFIGSKESVRKQIGMAVPVQGARIVLSALFRSLEGIKYPSVEPNLTSAIPRRAVATGTEPLIHR